MPHHLQDEVLVLIGGGLDEEQVEVPLVDLAADQRGRAQPVEGGGVRGGVVERCQRAELPFIKGVGVAQFFTDPVFLVTALTDPEAGTRGISSSPRTRCSTSATTSVRVMPEFSSMKSIACSRVQPLE